MRKFLMLGCLLAFLLTGTVPVFGAKFHVIAPNGDFWTELEEGETKLPEWTSENPRQDAQFRNGGEFWFHTHQETSTDCFEGTIQVVEPGRYVAVTGLNMEGFQQLAVVYVYFDEFEVIDEYLKGKEKEDYTYQIQTTSPAKFPKPTFSVLSKPAFLDIDNWGKVTGILPEELIDCLYKFEVRGYQPLMLPRTDTNEFKLEVQCTPDIKLDHNYTGLDLANLGRIAEPMKKFIKRRVPTFQKIEEAKAGLNAGKDLDQDRYDEVTFRIGYPECFEVYYKPEMLEEHRLKDEEEIAAYLCNQPVYIKPLAPVDSGLNLIYHYRDPKRTPVSDSSPINITMPPPDLTGYWGIGGKAVEDSLEDDRDYYLVSGPFQVDLKGVAALNGSLKFTVKALAGTPQPNFAVYSDPQMTQLLGTGPTFELSQRQSGTGTDIGTGAGTTGGRLPGLANNGSATVYIKPLVPGKIDVELTYIHENGRINTLYSDKLCIGMEAVNIIGYYMNGRNTSGVEIPEAREDNPQSLLIPVTFPGESPAVAKIKLKTNGGGQGTLTLSTAGVPVDGIKFYYDAELTREFFHDQLAAAFNGGDELTLYMTCNALINDGVIKFSKSVSQSESADFLHFSSWYDCACLDNCMPGREQAQNSSVHYSLTLGTNDYGSSAGQIELDAEELSLDLLSKDFFHILPGSTCEVEYNASELITSIDTGVICANITHSSQTIDGKSYITRIVVRFAKNRTASPFRTVQFLLGDISGGKVGSLTITNTLSGGTGTVVRTAKFTAPSPGVLVLDDNGVISKTEIESLYGHKTKTYTIGNPVVYQRVEEYELAPFERLMSKTEGDQTTTYTYYTDRTDGTAYGNLRSVTSPRGNSEAYTYDKQGRLATLTQYTGDSELRKNYTYFQRAMVDGAELEAPVNATTGNFVYSGVGANSTIRVTGSRTVTKTFNGATQVGQTEALIYTDYSKPSRETVYASGAQTMVAETYYVSDSASPFYGRPRLVRHPDGTVTTYTYQRQTDYETVVKSDGAPTTASGGTCSVSNGIKTTTRISPDGVTLFEEKRDIATNLVLESVTVTAQDSFGRPTAFSYGDGSTSTCGYGCCGVEWVVNRDGVRTDYLYDNASRRLVGTTGNGISGLLSYDDAGNLLTQTVKGRDNTEQTTVATFDLGRNCLSVTDPLGAVTRFADHGDSITNPDGSTWVSSWNNGLVTAIGGTSVYPISFEYGVDRVKVMPQNVTSTTDWLGRDVKLEFGNQSSRNLVYNAKGQLTRATTPGGKVYLYGYDAMGRLTQTALDLNGNGIIDAADLVDTTTYSYASKNGKATGVVRKERRYGSASHQMSLAETASDGSTWSLTDENGITVTGTRQRTGGGNVTVEMVFPDGSKQKQYYRNDLPVRFETFGKDGSAGPVTLFTYDQFDRQATLTRKIGETVVDTTTFGYDAADRLTATTENGRQTTVVYDVMGRPEQEIAPGNARRHFQYYPTGDLKRLSGTGTYTAEYEYDNQGRRVALTTYRSSTQPQTTRWSYDAVGNVTAIADPSGKAVEYGYDLDGRVTLRRWARGVETTYGYDSFGAPAWVRYSDGTPEITYTRNYLGQLLQVADGVGTSVFTYNPQLRLSTLTVPNVAGNLLAYSYDTMGNLSGYELRAGTRTEQSAGYGYDAFNRVKSLTAGLDALAYEYRPGLALVQEIAMRRSGTTFLTNTYTYDARHRLTGISSSVPQQTARHGIYTWNDRDQRTKWEEPSGFSWNYEYDELGQVSRGWREDAAATPIPGQYFGYEYDTIGNRLRAQTGFEEMTYRYDGNALNQYTQEVIPGLVPVFGEAAATATVKAIRATDTVHYPPKFGLTPSRAGKYFHGMFPVDNSAGPVTLDYHVYAIQPDPTDPNRDLIRKEAQSYTVPAAKRPFTYDDDGNMLTGHGWTYTWNGENRLVRAVKDGVDIAFTYDYAGRRSSKTVSDAGTVTAKTVYVYNQFQLTEERDGLNGNALLRRYTWDPVLGTPAWVYDAALDTTYYYQTDANRNVAALVDGAGNAVAEYVYTPFGELLLHSGSYALTNPLRFSSEYYDSDLELVYYNYRYYHPGLGRWLSRDPIGIAGGLNLYAMVGNDPVNLIDILGLAGMYFMDPGGMNNLNPASMNNVYLAKYHEDELNKQPIKVQQEVRNNMYSAFWSGTSILVSVTPFGIVADTAEMLVALYSGDKGQIVLAGFAFLPLGEVVSTAGKAGKSVFKCGAKVTDVAIEVAEQGLKQADEIVDAVESVVKAKAVHNPYGRLGGPLHQGKITEVAAMFGEDYKIYSEVFVQTPGGYKQSRFMDLVVVDDLGNAWGIQVGRQTKAGLPVSRERKALEDIMGVLGVDVREGTLKGVIFIPYN